MTGKSLEREENLQRVSVFKFSLYFYRFVVYFNTLKTYDKFYLKNIHTRR